MKQMKQSCFSSLPCLQDWVAHALYVTDLKPQSGDAQLCCLHSVLELATVPSLLPPPPSTAAYGGAKLEGKHDHNSARNVSQVVVC